MKTLARRVRLSASATYKAPKCYGSFRMEGKCLLCSIGRYCREGYPTEPEEVKTSM